LLAPIGALGAAGAVAVSDDGRPVSNAELMRRALEYAQHFGIPVIQHAQDMDLTGDGVMHEGEWSARSGMPGIPGLAEDVMVARDLLLVEETGGRYHLAHMSTARAAGLVRDAKRRGLPVTCLGAPFYAGWGLTRDLGAVPDRRQARPDLVQLAHAALIAYPRYWDPVSRRPCPPEVALVSARKMFMP